MQIVDREKLLNGPEGADRREPALRPRSARLELPPSIGAHTTFPMLGMDVPEFAKDKGGAKRDFALIVDESLVNECQEARQMVWIADITDEKRSRSTSRAGRCPRRAAISARAAGASARIRRTRT